MNTIKSHLRFTRSQRNGIFFLLFLIILFQCIYFFEIPMNVGTFPSHEITTNNKQFIAFQKQIDSIRLIESKKKEFKIFPFNPNYLNDYKGYTFGMTTEQIDKLLMHRQTGKFVNTDQEFQKITGISDSLLNIMSPYFKFPDWTDKKNILSNNSFGKEQSKKSIPLKDLNIATAEDLKKISGIGDKLSLRIIKYRDRLQGFTIAEQLYEVYGVKKNIADDVLKVYPVLTTPEIKKRNINEASLNDFTSIIYINYHLAKSIIEYRSEEGEISNMDELLKIEGFTPKKISRIKLYLKLD